MTEVLQFDDVREILQAIGPEYGSRFQIAPKPVSGKCLRHEKDLASLTSQAERLVFDHAPLDVFYILFLTACYLRKMDADVHK